MPTMNMGSFSNPRMPYTVGSFGSPYTGGTDKTQLDSLMKGDLLSPEDFAALPESLRQAFGNYRLYASSWQQKRRGKDTARSAYGAALEGRDVIPASERGAAGAMRGGGRVVGTAGGGAGVHTDISGQRMRIPETATGRDISGQPRFRIPEEETAYRQQEAVRKYEEAQFAPRMEQRAMTEAVSRSETKRALEAERREVDADINSTIDRLLKSKDLNEVKEGRRLQAELNKLKESERRREFTTKRDDRKYEQQDKLLAARHEYTKELEDLRHGLRVDMQDMRHEQRLEYLDEQQQNRIQAMGAAMDERTANREFLSAVAIAKERRNAEVTLHNIQLRHALSYNKEGAVAVDAAKRAIKAIDDKYEAMRDTAQAERDLRVQQIKAGIGKDKAQGEPTVGDVVDGYEYIGGDPSKSESWKAIK